MKETQKIRESIMALELTSDLFFSIVLEDKVVCQEVVEILLNRPIEILEVKCQYTILNLSYHSIRIDILAKEVDGRIISLEMHPQSNENRVKRTRFNVGSIDVQTLKKGGKYQDVQDVIHIYIAKSDFLKTRKGINCINRIVKGTDIEVPNGVEEYYIVLSCEGDTPEQTALMRYMVHSQDIYESDIFPKLVERVNYLKKEQGGHTIMCEIMDQLLREEREEVLAEVQIKIDKANEEAKKAKEAESKAKEAESKAKEAESKARIELNKIKEKIIKDLMDKLQLTEQDAKNYLAF